MWNVLSWIRKYREMSQHHTRIILKRDKDSLVPARFHLQNDTSVTWRIRNPWRRDGINTYGDEGFYYTEIPNVLSKIWKNPKKNWVFRFWIFINPIIETGHVLFVSPFIVKWNEVYTWEISRSFLAISSLIAVSFFFSTQRKMNRETSLPVRTDIYSSLWLYT